MSGGINEWINKTKSSKGVNKINYLSEEGDLAS